MWNTMGARLTYSVPLAWAPCTMNYTGNSCSSSLCPDLCSREFSGHVTLLHGTQRLYLDITACSDLLEQLCVSVLGGMKSEDSWKTLNLMEAEEEANANSTMIRLSKMSSYSLERHSNQSWFVWNQTCNFTFAPAFALFVLFPCFRPAPSDFFLSFLLTKIISSSFRPCIAT